MFAFKLNFSVVRKQLLKTLTSVLRQNEPHEQIETMANHGPLYKRIKRDKKHPQINHVEETVTI